MTNPIAIVLALVIATGNCRVVVTTGHFHLFQNACVYIFCQWRQDLLVFERR